MNSLLRSLWAVVITSFMLSSVGSAAAQPSDERMLVLAVGKGRGSDARLVTGVSEHLQRAGMLLTEGSLTAQERACDSPECIEELARREGASLALTAKIQESSSSSFFITMALFDVVRRAPLQETAVCDQCNQELLIIKLGDVADKLIRQCRAARQGPARLTPPPNVPIVPLVPELPGASTNGSGSPPQVEPGFFAKLSPTRKIAAGVLGGLAAATLITSIALTAKNGSDTTGCTLRPDVKNDRCILNTTSGFATGYALTGVLVIGVGVTLFWPSK